MKKSKEVLKSYFETGDRPTQEQFTNLIDSFVHVDQSSNAQNNKIRTIDLGIIRASGRLSPEAAILQRINQMTPPLVVEEDENIVFEFTVDSGEIEYLMEGPISR